MSQIKLSYVEDLSASHDFWNMKARIIRLWKQYHNWDLILIDEKGVKIQAVVKNQIAKDHKDTLHEDAVVLLKQFGVAAQDDKYKVIPLQHRINFFKCTSVETVPTFSGHPYGFKWDSFPDINGDKCNKQLTVDIIGRVAWTGNMEKFRNAKKDCKRMHIDLQDLEENVMRCTFWDDFAELCNSFVSSHNSSEMVIVIVQHGRVKEWGGVKTIQNDKYATRIFLNEDIQDANDFRRRMILKMGPENSQTVLSSQLSYPQRDEFVLQNPKKKVDEIPDIDKEQYCVVLATIQMVEEGHGWFYKAHRKCGRKVYTKKEFLEHAKDIPDNFLDAPIDSLWCLQCIGMADNLYPRFKVQCRVQDSTGSVSFTLFDKDVSKILGLAAVDIRDRQLKSGDMETFPHEVLNLQNKVLAFKILVADYNLQNNYHVYTVSKYCEDPEIIQELQSVEQGDPATPDDIGGPSIRLDEESQHGGDSKDATSATGSSLVMDVEKNTATSPPLKRAVTAVVEGKELDAGSAVRNVKKKLP